MQMIPALWCIVDTKKAKPRKIATVCRYYEAPCSDFDRLADPTVKSHGKKQTFDISPVVKGNDPKHRHVNYI